MFSVKECVLFLKQFSSYQNTKLVKTYLWIGKCHNIPFSLEVFSSESFFNSSHTIKDFAWTSILGSQETCNPVIHLGRLWPLLWICQLVAKNLRCRWHKAKSGGVCTSGTDIILQQSFTFKIELFFSHQRWLPEMEAHVSRCWAGKIDLILLNNEKWKWVFHYLKTG